MSEVGGPHSDDLREFYFSAQPDLIAFDTLQFDHPAFDQPARVVNDGADLVATLETGGGAVTFTRCMFKLTLPEQSSGGLPTMDLEVSNVTRLLVPYLDLAAESEEPVEITYRQFLSDDLSAPALVLPGLTLQKSNASLLKVVATAGYQNFLYRPSPRRKYTTKEFPGLAR